MKIGVIGSGGREHAILHKIARDSSEHELIALPGNGGTGALAKNVAVDAGDVKALFTAVREQKCELVIVGPEIPLAAGLTDLLTQAGVSCFGPTAAAARIESSKVFAKELMRSEGVPTAKFEVFSDFDSISRYVRASRTDEWVVKADGLAAGKGAFVCDSVAETLDVAKSLLVDRILGAAGARVVLEERMRGREASCMFWSDGKDFRALPVARDYKRAFDGDRGPNTGGMGSLCPAPDWNASLQKTVEDQIITPVLRGLATRGSTFVGVLYAGLMLTQQGPRVIEFNCRLGDPETQTILAVWNGDFVSHALACVEGRLGKLAKAAESNCAAVSVVLAADGYPDRYEKGLELHTVPDSPQAYTLHAGTTIHDSKLVSSGGRVLNAVGVGESLETARGRAYELVHHLAAPGLRYRTDIAQ